MVFWMVFAWNCPLRVPFPVPEDGVDKDSAWCFKQALKCCFSSFSFGLLHRIVCIHLILKKAASNLVWRTITARRVSVQHISPCLRWDWWIPVLRPVWSSTSPWSLVSQWASELFLGLMGTDGGRTLQCRFDTWMNLFSLVVGRICSLKVKGFRLFWAVQLLSWLLGVYNNYLNETDHHLLAVIKCAKCLLESSGLQDLLSCSQKS